MKIFLSWSGQRSHKLALALRDWIPTVVQGAEPWVSSKDIDAGRLWADSLFTELKHCDLGIVCLTKDRLTSKWSQWMLFEAGSMAISTNKAILIPYCLDVSADELSEGPLSLFQTKKANKAGTWEMIETLSRVARERDPRTLKQQFEKLWPLLASKLDAIPADSSDAVVVSDVLCAYSEAFEHEGVEHDVQALRKNFPDRVTVMPRVTHIGLTDTLARTKKDIAIVHIIAGASGNGHLQLDDEVAAEDLDHLLEIRGTELVFLATCFTTALGEKLSRKRNRSVITGYGESQPANWGPWVARFYDYLGSGKGLFEAYDEAKAVYPLPIVLLGKRNCSFVLRRKPSRTPQGHVASTLG